MNEPPGTGICDHRPSPNHASQRAWVAPMRALEDSHPGQQADGVTLGVGYPGSVLATVAPPVGLSCSAWTLSLRRADYRIQSNIDRSEA